VGISRKLVVRVASAAALASLLAACDKCGDFVPPIRFQADQADLLQVCRDEAPKKF
jgi:hypothetical protein